MTPTRAAAQPELVTFTRHIAPIIYDACASCHRPDGPAPFSLLRYEDVRQRARQVVITTRARFMPPWKAEPTADFVGQRRLTDREIELLQRWVEQGAPEGRRSDLPPMPPHRGGWQQGTPDLVVTLAEPFTLRSDASDVFRIFALPLPIDRVRYVRGIEFLPGNARVVHHANLRLDYTPSTRQLDAADPLPGYDGLMPRSAVYPEGHFLGWTPGQVAPLVPASFAWELRPGADLVVQLHMQPSGARELVRPQIGLYFSDRAPTRTPAILRLGSQGIEIPPGDPRYIVRDSFVLPADVEVHAVQPHAHYRAREIKGIAVRPDGRSELLIHIRDWDFRWQHVYRYVNPVSLPKGTRLAMEYVYDNSAANPRNPQIPPQRVFWGQRSFDEMGDLWFQLVPSHPADLAPLNTDVQRKMTAEDIVGLETMLRATPDDPELHDDAGVLYLAVGQPARAAEHFRASLKSRPESAAAHFNLATALTVTGAMQEAVAEYRRALAIRPEYASAHNNLANVLLAAGQRAAALEHLRSAVRFDAGNEQAHRNLAWELAAHASSSASETREAVRLAERAAALTSRRDALTLDVLAAAYAAAGDFTRAIETAEAALRLSPPAALASAITERLSLYRRGQPYRR